VTNTRLPGVSYFFFPKTIVPTVLELNFSVQRPRENHLGRGIMLRPRVATLIQFRSVDPVQVNPLLRPIDEAKNNKFVKVAIKNADWVSIFLSCCALQTLRIQNPGFKSGISYSL
jgi:hypothetical protein